MSNYASLISNFMQERKIIEETVTPLTPRSVPVQLPSEWLSISKADEVRNSESTELTHGESKQTELQKQTVRLLEYLSSVVSILTMFLLAEKKLLTH